MSREKYTHEIAVYDGVSDDTSIIGFNAESLQSGADEDVIDIIVEMKRSFKGTSAKPINGESYRYIEVQPPLETADIDHIRNMIIDDTERFTSRITDLRIASVGATALQARLAA